MYIRSKLKVRRTHDLTQKQVVIPFICRSTDCHLDPIVLLKIYNPETSQYNSFAKFVLPNSDARAIHCFSVGSNIHFFQVGNSPKFWIYRGNSQKIESRSWPDGEIHEFFFHLSVNAKLVFGCVPVEECKRKFPFSSILGLQTYVLITV